MRKFRYTIPAVNPSPNPLPWRRKASNTLGSPGDGFENWGRGAQGRATMEKITELKIPARSVGGSGIFSGYMVKGDSLPQRSWLPSS